MQHHIDVMGDKVRETSPTLTSSVLEIYGVAVAELKATIPRVAEGIRCTHRPVRWRGFTRLSS